jgi:tetratricopeptide (TPR) repeat protein
LTTDELVDEIFGRCRERIERGEPVDVDEILRIHPDLAAPLRKRFAAARLLDGAAARRRARTADSVAAARVGTSLGPYRIESILGAGGMGTVYLASDGNARVAVKVFHPHLVARERFAARFRREAALGRRVRHPNVVRTLDAGEAREDERIVRFLVMEHVEGRTLRELLDDSGRLPEQLCRHIGREIAKGLAAIHEAGAVHRDLKPENVIVTNDHAVKVMDLGVARVEGAATLSETGAFVGSLRYGAPEQIKSSGALDHRVDLHALGLVLYELATGAHPFAGDEFHDVVRQILDVRPPRLGAAAPQVSPFLEELVGLLLEKDRERRPAGAAEVATILDEGESSAWWRERAVAIRRETRRPLRRIGVPRETAVYGRDPALATLRALFDSAKAGDGRVVLVEGEAGIGKSRLVDELATSLWTAGEDVDFLVGSYPPGGAATASGAFATAYRAHLGDDESAVREALPQTPLLVPAFAALLSGAVAPEGAERLTKDSLQTVFVHATRSFAARRTTVVFIDDLHFAPEEGLALFASLALATSGHRILLVGGARRSLDAGWSAGVARLPNASRLPIERLSPKDLVSLLKDALKSEHLATELAGKIAEKSDGNPFFVFEILRGMREGRFLTKKPDGTWITSRAIRDIEIPPSIVEVIQARVSELDAEDRDVLEVAACVGFEFDAALVGAVLRVEPIPLLQRLGRIEKSRRLVRSVDRLFAFDHHQVQEVLYAGLSRPLREAYHASIAEAIERRSETSTGGLDGARCVDLAEHFLKGAKGGSALPYLDRALTHLETRYLNEGAAGLCERALAAPNLVAGEKRVTLLLRLASRLDLFGRREAHLSAVEEALRVAREIGDRPHETVATGILGFSLYRLGRFAEAREHQERALALARKIGDRSAEGWAMGRLGVALHAMARYADAREQFERHVALAREIGERRGEATAMGNLGAVFQSEGDFAEARRHYESACALARELGDRQGEIVPMTNLGRVLLALGLHDEALEHDERALALAREVGDRLYEAHLLGDLGSVFLALGRLAEARDHGERQLALAREIGDRVGEATAHSDLGIGFRSLGRFDDAKSHYEQGLAIVREIGHRYDESAALVELAHLAREADDVPRAERLLAQSIEIRRAVGARADESDSLLVRGALLARAGRIDEARADLVAALATARELGIPGVEAVASAHLAGLPGGDTAAALAVFAEHGDRLDVPMRMQARFLLWRATRDRVHLVDAKRLLDFLVENAPPGSAGSMLENVRLNREIVAAWRVDDAARA